MTKTRFVERVSKVFVLGALRNDGDRDGAVIQHEVTDAPQNTPPDKAEPARSHDDVVAMETVGAGNDQFPWRRGVLGVNASLNLKGSQEGVSAAVEKGRSFPCGYRIQFCAQESSA